MPQSTTDIPTHLGFARVRNPVLLVFPDVTINGIIERPGAMLRLISARLATKNEREDYEDNPNL